MHTFRARASIPWIVLMGLGLCACGAGGLQEPSWAEQGPAKIGACPDVQGTFLLEDELAMQLLVGDRVPPGSIIEIKGSGLGGLVITQLNDTPRDANLAERGETHTVGVGSLQCQEGWLLMPHGLSPASVFPGGWGEVVDHTSLGLRRNAQGALVVRHALHARRGFAVWCGDGCKYVPIPGTGRWLRHHTQHQAYTMSPPLAVGEAPSKVSWQQTGLSPGSVEAKTVQALREAMPSALRLIAIEAADDQALRLTVVAHDGLPMAAVEEGLRYLSAPAQLVSRTRRPGGGNELVLHVQKLKIKSEAELTQARERAQAQDASLRSLSNRFLAGLPKGVQLNRFQPSNGGYEADIRLPPDQTTAYFQMNVRFNGDFIDMAVRSERPHPMGGTAVTVWVRAL